jgi:hypothetical protein
VAKNWRELLRLGQSRFQSGPLFTAKPVLTLTTTTQVILQFLQADIVSIGQGLDLIAERLNLALVGIELRRENMNLVAEDLDSQVKLGEVAVAGGGAAFLASINLVESRGQGQEASHRKND